MVLDSVLGALYIAYGAAEGGRRSAYRSGECPVYPAKAACPSHKFVRIDFVGFFLGYCLVSEDDQVSW